MNKVGIHLFSTHEDSTNNLARMYSSPIEMKSPLGESFYFPCKHETMKTFDKYSNCKNCGVFMNQESGTFGYKTKKAAYSSLFPVSSLIKTMHKDDSQLNPPKNLNYLKSRSSTIEYIFNSAAKLGLSLNSAYLSILYLDKTISNLLPSSLPFSLSSSVLPHSSSVHHTSSLPSPPSSSLPPQPSSSLPLQPSSSLCPSSSFPLPPPSLHPSFFPTNLCAGTLLLIAAKAIELDERIPFIPKMRRSILGNFFCEDIKKCEGKLLECLDWNLQKTTVFDVLEFFMSQGIIFRGDCIDGKEVGETETLARGSRNSTKRVNIEENLNGNDSNKTRCVDNNDNSKIINNGDNMTNIGNVDHSEDSKSKNEDNGGVAGREDCGEKEENEGGEQKFAAPFINEENRSKIGRSICLERKIYDVACNIEKDLVRLCGMIIKDNDFLDVSIKTLSASMIAFIRKKNNITPIWNPALEQISDGVLFSHLEPTLKLIINKYDYFFSSIYFDSMIKDFKTFNFASKKFSLVALTESKSRENYENYREHDMNGRQVNSTYQKQNLSSLNQKNSMEVVTSNFDKDLKSIITMVNDLQMKNENFKNEVKVKKDNAEINFFKNEVRAKNENSLHIDSKIENFGLNFGVDRTARNVENEVGVNLGPILKDADNKRNIEGRLNSQNNVGINMNGKNLACFSDENNQRLTIGQLSRRVEIVYEKILHPQGNFVNQARKENSNGKLL